jgi:hypothetical protein
MLGKLFVLIDQVHQYQDARSLKEKLPMEMLEEFHTRQKRDAALPENSTVKYLFLLF